MLKFSQILTNLVRAVKFHNVCSHLATIPGTKPIPKVIRMRSDSEYKVGKKYAIQNLEKLFKLKKAIAYRIVSENRRLCRVNSVLMDKNYLMYRKKGISDETLLKYPFLLAEIDLNAKMSVLDKLPFDINSIAALFVLDVEKLKKIFEKHGKTRIEIISELINLSEQDCCELLTEKPFILTMPLEKIEANVNLLKEYGISSEEIRKDPWVLRYSTGLIRDRLEMVKMQKIATVKTWMVRAKPEIFQHYIQRRFDNKEVLGDSSITEYLSRRLDCNLETTMFLLSRMPALQHKNLKRLKEIIDFLFSKGFSPSHICRVPKILTHSVETMKIRLEQLENSDVQIDSLHMLTKSQKQFNQYYEACISKKLKNKH